MGPTRWRFQEAPIDYPPPWFASYHRATFRSVGLQDCGGKTRVRGWGRNYLRGMVITLVEGLRDASLAIALGNDPGTEKHLVTRGAISPDVSPVRRNAIGHTEPP